MGLAGYRKCVQIIADAIIEIGGESLKEYGQDVDMAEHAMDKLYNSIEISDYDISISVFNDWKRNRDPKKEYPIKVKTDE